MPVKYGDIGKKSNDVFEDKFWAGGLKIQDKAEGGDDVLSVLPRYNKGVGLKFVYKWAIAALPGAKAEATAEVTQKAGVETELQLSKGALSATVKNDSADTSVELAVKETIAGLKSGVSVKADGFSKVPAYEFSGNTAYELALDALTVQAGAKVKVKGAVKPEARAALLTSFGEFFLKWDGSKPDGTFQTAVLIPGPRLLGYQLSFANTSLLKNDVSLSNTTVAVQARQSKSLMYCVKLDKAHTPKPEPAVSVVMSHNPIADSKEAVNITATWNFGSKGPILGLTATRA
eukprot:TRINITY_DN2007_c0_g1_i1.p2 TRINITY_DN2007_c0_g1~~TRINITY_DN2007_c0_g1_i1.p2  ORF type:complete len:289 (+),score=147.41 TRINITY_DN2007_c0_g1_i1:125-991(+)